MKIGGEFVDRPLVDEDSLVDWFHGDGSEVEAEALEICLRSLLPKVEFVIFSTAPCVIVDTPSEQPYVGWVDEGLAVAIGGNGSAAKSSDELGRLASTLFNDDGWTDSIGPTEFAPRFL